MKSSTRRIQPLVAVKALKRLIANPDNTEEVFAIIRAMSGDSLFRAFNRFKLVPSPVPAQSRGPAVPAQKL